MTVDQQSDENMFWCLPPGLTLHDIDPDFYFTLEATHDISVTCIYCLQRKLHLLYHKLCSAGVKILSFSLVLQSHVVNEILFQLSDSTACYQVRVRIFRTWSLQSWDNVAVGDILLWSPSSLITVLSLATDRTVTMISIEQELWKIIQFLFMPE